MFQEAGHNPYPDQPSSYGSGMDFVPSVDFIVKMGIMGDTKNFYPSDR
jgi:hypothetical protein